MDAEQIRQLKPKLHEFLARFADCFRRDSREHLPVYIEGQLSDLPRKTVEPIALKAQMPVRTLQQFLSSHRWDEDLLRQHLHEIVATEHASSMALAVFDETSDAKKGDKTPGVQRQYCGAVGKQENCIVTVHLGYAVGDFHCLLDGELFLPESWAADRERCRAAGIPETMGYRPKTEIALELYDRARANGVTFAYVTFDEWYGSKPEFLHGLTERAQKWVGEVPRNFRAWSEPPRVVTRCFRRHSRGRSRRTPRPAAGSRKLGTVEALCRLDPGWRDQPWQAFRIKDGEKGPIVWEVKHALIYLPDRHGLPLPQPYHLIMARNVIDPEEIKYFVGGAPADTPVATLLRAGFGRWHIERCFEDQKGEVGLAHYEGRRYLGLKRHLLLSAVSYLFLARMHQELRGEKPGVNCVPGPHGRLRRGPQLVAERSRQPQVIRTSRQGNPLCSDPQRSGPQEPHQNHKTQTAGYRHPAFQPLSMLKRYDLAL